MRRNNKKEIEKINNLYETLWNLYDVSYIKLGNVLLSRLERKHYGIKTLNVLIKCINWFTDTYDKNKYHIEIYYDPHQGRNHPFISVMNAKNVRINKIEMTKNGAVNCYEDGKVDDTYDI